MTMKRAIEKIEAEIPNTPDPDKFLKGVTSGMSRCLEIISEEAETSYDECGELIKKIRITEDKMQRLFWEIQEIGDSIE